MVNMRVTVLTGLTFGLVWIVFKMVAHWGGFFGYDPTPAILFNMLCLLLSISIGLYLHKKQEKEYGNALNDIKNGLTAGMPYIMLVSVFIYFYYSSIDPDYNAHQIAEAETEIMKMLNDPQGLEDIKKSNPEFEVQTKEEIFESLRQGPRSFYNPTSTMTLSLLGLLVLGTMNSIFITIIYRRLIFRQS